MSHDITKNIFKTFLGLCNNEFYASYTDIIRMVKNRKFMQGMEEIQNV